MAHRILIVDDEKLTRVTLQTSLEDAGYEAIAVSNPYEALEVLEHQCPDAVLTDLRMPSMTGVELLRRLRQRRPEIPVLLMTAFGSIASAVEAMREGAYDYLAKPLNTEELLLRLGRALQHSDDVAELRRLRDAASPGSGADGMVFRSAAMRHVSERAAAVAESEITVLIQGETGTGKEVVARFIHNRSERHGGPFVVVNCGGLNPNLVDSELFGHEAGAFTGATGLRRGRIETARGGTILIDEVDDLPPEIQLKLLRFLQERSFERVGGNDPIPADARVLCATKQPLLELVDAGMFRDDLFYRINSVVVLIPPLRDRRDDVLPLATRFIAELTAGRREPPCLAPAARDALLEHRWPGNVRELRHAIEHAVTFARGQTIELQHLPAALSQSGEPPNIAVQVALAHLESASFVDVVAECERQLIEWALGRSAGNQGRAAELLGLSRTTFRGRLDAMRSRAAEPGVDDSARES